MFEMMLSTFCHVKFHVDRHGLLVKSSRRFDGFRRFRHPFGLTKQPFSRFLVRWVGASRVS
jgi:hypothetical protein